MSKPKRQVRHAFRFKIAGHDNETTTLVGWAKVIKAKKPVAISLKADDVRRSIELGGVGSTQTCSMAVCAKRSADAFPHPVEGYVDWYYRRAFVVSKVSRETRLPSECFVYQHSDGIAQLNDTKGGQQKLLRSLEKNGDREIRLYRVTTQKGHSGEKTGERGPRRRPSSPKGAALRFAVAKLGGIDQPAPGK